MAKVKYYLEQELVFVDKLKNPRFIDLTGKNFGRLFVLGFAGQDRHGTRLWFCKCECGNISKVQGEKLNSGHTKSCGCYLIEAVSKSSTKHGCRKKSIYRTWASMMQRCTNEKNTDFYDYGGRGITVCDRWQKFENFLADMGEKPKGKTLDRINNSKGYYKENCRWATPIEQANNKRNNRFLTFNNKTQTLSQWERELGMNRGVLSARINRYSWSIERAITT